MTPLHERHYARSGVFSQGDNSPCGEGLGVGVPVAETARANNNDPPPQPSPTRGEGADRDWGSIDPKHAVHHCFPASVAKRVVSPLGRSSASGCPSIM